MQEQCTVVDFVLSPEIMERRKYNSYSTSFKLAVINGEDLTVNHDSSYYWKTKGKDKILEAAGMDGTIELIKNREEVNEKLNEVFTDLFDFFMKFIRGRKALEKQFKKQRATIVCLIEDLKAFTDTLTSCKWFGITERTYFNWKSKPICKLTYTKECPNIVSNQITDRERRILEDDYFFHEKYADRSISELYAQTLADKRVFVSNTLFYEFARFLGEDERRRPRKKEKRKKGLRADVSKQIIHMDKTQFPIKDLTNTKPAWVSLVCDNRSRAILGFLVARSSHSRYTLANLRQSIEQHHLLDKEFWLVTDDGSENKGLVRDFVDQNPKIKHKIAQLTIPFSNSMIEAAIKQLKYRYLKKREFDSMEELIAALVLAVEVYNNRPRRILLGKTPLQVLNGDEQDLWEFKALQQEHRKRRLEENRQFKCLLARYSSLKQVC